MVTEEDIINKYNEIIIDAHVQDLVELLPEIESDQFIMQNLTRAKEKMNEAKKYAKNNPS